MYKLCKTEQSAARQRAIELELLNFLKQKRFEDVTSTELCEKMNMPRKAFYRYFDSKEDALYALIDHSMSDYSGFTADRSGETNRSLTREIEEYFKFWYERRDFLSAIDRSGLIGVFIERTVNYPVNDRISVVRFLPGEDDVSRDKIFKFAFAGLVYTVIAWYREGFKESTRDMAKIACRLLREPLFPRLESIGIGK